MAAKRDTVIEVNMTELARAGGEARATALSAARRKEIAQAAARARWGDKPKKKK